MKQTSRALWLLAGLTSLFCLVLVTDVIPWLRGEVPWLPGDSAWIWPYGTPRGLSIFPCVLGIAIYIVGALILLDRTQQTTTGYPVRLILWTFGGAVLLPMLLMTLEGRPLFLLFARSSSSVVGGYQYAGNMIHDLSDTLYHWPQFIMDYRAVKPFGGIAIAPPGLAVVYYAAGKAFEAVPPVAQTFGALVRPLQCHNLDMTTWSDSEWSNVWVQMAMPLWAALAVAPLYRLGRMIFDRRTACWAVVLWPLVPGMNIFSPRFNVFYPLMLLVMLTVLWRGLDRSRPSWRWLLIAVAGFIVSVGIFLNISLFPLGLLGGLTILIYWWKNKDAGRSLPVLIGNLVAFGVGCAALWLFYGTLTHVTIFDMLNLSLTQHLAMNRPYVPWLFMHPYDMFIFVGIPIAALAIWHMVRGSFKDSSRSEIFTLAAGLTLVIMVLSGTARGETGRVWLFFAPLWILLAAEILNRWQVQRNERATGLAGLSILIMQGLCLLSMAAILRANFTELTVPPSPPSADQAATFPINAQFKHGNDTLTFVGVSIDKTATTARLYLHWRADTYIQRPYLLSLVPVPPDQSSLKGYDWDPLDWHYPPACWTPGQEFIDTVDVPLKDNNGKSQPGSWLFSLSVNDVFTHESMAVTGQNGQTQVGIGPVNIPAQ
ncbi:MAG: glycosyltransferase family 39 protein [Chloroflexota bacterium]